MASETKAPTTRRKTTAEPAAKPKKASTAKAAKAITPKAEPAKKKVAVAEKTAKPAEKKPRKTKATAMPITAEMRLRHIELAAYYIAEKRGFSGSPADDWLAAEQQIDHLLMAGQLPA
jgi:hypothetical protein